MPCRYDPSPQEIAEMKKEETKKLVAPYVRKLDELTKLLCKACKILMQIDGQIFDTELNKWYHKHYKLDEERNKIEQEKKRLKRLEKSALAKLTKEEKEVLGLFK